MIPFLNQPWGWTPLAPLLCAIHCVATPIMVAFVPALAPVEALEAWFLAGTAALVGLALVSGLRNHGEWKVAVPMALGLVAWAASVGHAFHPVPEPATSSVAALTVAGGLLWNARLHCVHNERSVARSCGCPGCGGEETKAVGASGPGGDRLDPSEALGAQSRT